MAPLKAGLHYTTLEKYGTQEKAEQRKIRQRIINFDGQTKDTRVKANVQNIKCAVVKGEEKLNKCSGQKESIVLCFRRSSLLEKLKEVPLMTKKDDSEFYDSEHGENYTDTNNHFQKLPRHSDQVLIEPD